MILRRTGQGRSFPTRRRGARCHRAHDVAAIRPSGRAGRRHRSFAGRRDRDARFGPAASARAHSDARREVRGRRRDRAGDAPRRRAAFLAEARDLALVLPGDSCASGRSTCLPAPPTIGSSPGVSRRSFAISWASTSRSCADSSSGWASRRYRCRSDPKSGVEGAAEVRASQLLSFAVNGICSFSKVPLRICTSPGSCSRR